MREHRTSSQLRGGKMRVRGKRVSLKIIYHAFLTIKIRNTNEFAIACCQRCTRFSRTHSPGITEYLGTDALKSLNPAAFQDPSLGKFLTALARYKSCNVPANELILINVKAATGEKMFSRVAHQIYTLCNYHDENVGCHLLFPRN